ncbi:hypothetical protein [Streptomyces djakartensis]|uniref:hypothetical protein n=1 Tax=Streptomyces djakartensis TaxID=68193 RepID=UPI0034DDE567
MKATVIADAQGRTLWVDALRPGRMHDVTAAPNEGTPSASSSFLTFRSSWTTATSGFAAITPGKH